MERFTPRIELKLAATHEDRQVIADLLEGFNESQAGPDAELPFAVMIRRNDSPDVILGGLWGLPYYRWLFVELLYVPAELRRMGLGTQLMHAAEAEALRRNCHGVWVDTFTFQARGFYEKLGYEVFAEIPEYPPGHKRLFLLKRLAAALAPK